jgi:hypothetical protein
MNDISEYERWWRLDLRYPPSTGYVPAIVAAALDRNRAARDRAAALPRRGDAEHALRAERLAVLSDREARWWRVLGSWVYSWDSGSVPLVFGAAAVAAAEGCRDDARFWREAAADWWARAEHRPTSDAAGALSNHPELGIGAA